MLSPSQLARKRAHDRKAQRAARARTRSYIEQLERELEECRDNHNKELQELRYSKRVLENEILALQNACQSLIVGHSCFASGMPPSCFENPLQVEYSSAARTVYDDLTFDKCAPLSSTILCAIPTNCKQVEVRPHSGQDISRNSEHGACLACDLRLPCLTHSSLATSRYQI